MKQLLIIAIMFLLAVSGCDSLTTAGGIQTDRFKEIKLSNNEKVIFSLLADQIFYFDLVDHSKQFRTIEVGVDYFHYGELEGSSGGLTMGANDPEIETRDERVKFVFTMNMDEDENTSTSSIHGDLRVIFKSGSSGSSSYSYPRQNLERGIRSWGYLLDQIDEIPYGEKIYVSYLTENVELNSMRSFDPELAIQPNNEFKYVYMYYVIVGQEPFQ